MLSHCVSPLVPGESDQIIKSDRPEVRIQDYQNKSNNCDIYYTTLNNFIGNLSLIPEELYTLCVLMRVVALFEAGYCHKQLVSPEHCNTAY
jgi:hypothetical protein